jgi:uncharacterized lipoprotein YehR (DUF1307 family)
MKSTLFVLIFTLVAALSGCGVKKDADVKSFIADIDQMALDISRAVDEKPATGVDRAQQLLDARKPELKAKFQTLKDLRGYQISEDTTKEFSDAVTRNVEKVGNLQIKYAEESAENAKLGQKLTKLADDFNSIFGV